MSGKLLSGGPGVRAISLVSRRYVLWLSLCLIILTGLLNPTPAWGEGSRTMHPDNGPGHRAWLEFITAGGGSATAGIARRSIIQVYVNAGETLYLGSSAVGIGAGVINYRDPNGVAGTCGATGLIANRTEEELGPNTLTAGGYTPCTINVATTGIWEVDFVGPNPTGGGGNNPPIILADANWTQPATTHSTAAWDVTVASAGGVEIRGRAFANYLALNMGGNGPLANPTALDVPYYILTDDGYLYEIDLNGMNPFGFIFFGNNKGFQDGSGNALYRSVQLTLADQFIAPDTIHNPNNPDTATDVTHKIFFDVPSSDLPATSGGDWLLRPSPVPPPTPSNFTFTGQQGTPNQLGAGLGGTFGFDVPLAFTGGFTVSIDLDGNGQYNDPIDRILNGTATPGVTNTIFWDGLDGQGNTVVPTAFNVTVRVTLNGGEVHFPFLDVEAHPNGMVIARMSAATGAVTPVDFTVYYDDRLLPATGTQIAPSPMSALGGISSVGGAHGFGDSNNLFTGYGDHKGIDTWVYVPGPPVALSGGLQIIQADMRIEKLPLQDPVITGGSVGYTIRVFNDGPSNITGATVSDPFAANLTGVTWTCVASAGASCTAAGAGAINDSVNIPNGGQVTYTISATTTEPAGGVINNTATVTLPPDATDPTPGNNTANATINVVGPASGANLSLTTTPGTTQGGVGSPVSFSVTISNAGPVDATNVQIATLIPPGAQVISGVPSVVSGGGSPGTYDPATGLWTIPLIPSGSVYTLQVTGVITATGQLVFVIEVVASDQPDPNSIPNNRVPTEDDYGSFTFNATGATGGTGGTLPPGLTLEDPFITKSVNPPFTRPGEIVTWTIIITNPGSLPFNNAIMTDNLPAQVQILSTSTTSGSVSFNGQQVTFQQAVVNPGQSVTITVTTRVRDNVAMPFILTNVACLNNAINQCAQASTVGALTLPATGQSPWSEMRAALLRLGIISLMLALVGVMAEVDRRRAGR